MSDTFLQPFEKPKGLIMKLAYYFTRREFGKVLTPLKVHSARLPAAFRPILFKSQQIGSETDPAAGARFTHSASGGAHQHLSFLHRYRSSVHDQRVDESSQV